MADLTLLAPQTSYFGLLNTSSSNGLTNTLQVIQDGLGRNSPLSLSQIGLDINTTMGSEFSINGVALIATATQINNVCANASFSAFTTALKLPAGTTVQRPGAPNNGDLRYNSTTQSGELYAAGAWMTINAGNPSGYYPGGPTYIQDTYASGTYNVCIGTQPQNITFRTECTLVGDSVVQSESSGSRLCALGYQSLMANSSGSDNCAAGHMSGKSIIAASRNSLFGNSSGYSNVSSDRNSYFGYRSGYLSTGSDNVYCGNSAGENNSQGDCNSFYGSESGMNSNIVSNCTGYGYRVLKENDIAGNSAFGSLAASQNISGTSIDAFGYRSQINNVLGDGNSSFARDTLFSNVDGDFNCAFGAQSQYSNTEGDNNSSYGNKSLYNNTASGNSVFGSSAGYENTTGTIDAYGYNCLLSNTIGQSNTGYGRYSLTNNISGGFNCAFGENSLSTHTDKGCNSAFGYNSAKLSTGNYTCAYGYESLLNNAGDGNCGYGFNSLTSNTSGTFNTGIGFSCMDSNVSGNSNCSVGAYSLQSSSVGSQNTACGAFSLYVLNDASNANLNTAAGFASGNSLFSGSSNSFFGANSCSTGSPSGLTGCTLLGASTVVSTGLTNATAIGYQANVTSNDTIILGKSGTNVGIGKTNALCPLDVVGLVLFKGTTTGFSNTGIRKSQVGFSTSGASSLNIDFPLSTLSPNIVNVRVHISVINVTGDKSAYSTSNAAAFYNNSAVTASTGTLPTITMTATAGYAPTAAWSISGTDLRLTVTGVAASTEIWVISYEVFNVYNTTA